MVRGTFSPARAWRLSVGPASTRTLGTTIEDQRGASNIECQMQLRRSGCCQGNTLHPAACVGARRQRTEVPGCSQGSRTPWLPVQVRHDAEDGQAGPHRMYVTPRRRGAEAPRQARVSSGRRPQSGPCYLLRHAPAARMEVCATVRTPSSKPMQPCHARTVHKALWA